MAVHVCVVFSVLYFAHGARISNETPDDNPEGIPAHGARIDSEGGDDNPEGIPGEESAVDIRNEYQRCVADCQNATAKLMPTTIHNIFGCEARCRGVMPVCVHPCFQPRLSLSLDVDCTSAEEARQWVQELVAHSIPPTVTSKAYDSRCPRVNCDTEVVLGAARSSYSCASTRQISEQEVRQGMAVSAYVHVPPGGVRSDEPVDATTIAFADKCKDGMGQVVLDCLDILFVHPTTGNEVIQAVPLPWVQTEGFADAARKCDADVTERLAVEMGQRMVDRVAALATKNKCGRCKLSAEGGTIWQTYMDDKSIELSATCAACPGGESFGFEGYCRRCPEGCARCDPSVEGKFVCVTSSRDTPTNHDLSCDEEPVLLSGMMHRLNRFWKGDQYAHTCEFVSGGR